MREPYLEGVAIHEDPESCVGVREHDGEALTGACTGRVSSRDIRCSRAPTPLSEAEGNTMERVFASAPIGPARSQTPCTCRNSARGNREIHWSPSSSGGEGRIGKSTDAIR
jgi:hypothetical protein